MQKRVTKAQNIAAVIIELFRIPLKIEPTIFLAHANDKQSDDNETVTTVSMTRRIVFDSDRDTDSVRLTDQFAAHQWISGVSTARLRIASRWALST